jgi:hypothetical protein
VTTGQQFSLQPVHLMTAASWVAKQVVWVLIRRRSCTGTARSASNNLEFTVQQDAAVYYELSKLIYVSKIIYLVY